MKLPQHRPGAAFRRWRRHTDLQHIEESVAKRIFDAGRNYERTYARRRKKWMEEDYER